MPNMLSTVLMALLCVIMATIGVMIAVNYIDKDFQRYQAESRCVNHHIRQGYERHDIETGNGTCWIKSRIEPTVVKLP